MFIFLAYNSDVSDDGVSNRFLLCVRNSLLISGNPFQGGKNMERGFLDRVYL
jgi:hypothetical protein